MDLEDKRKEVQNKTFLTSLKYAICGIKTAIKEENNMKRHLLFAAVAIILGFFFKITISKWLWILLAIFLVIVSEMLNTAIENLVDLVTDYKYHLLAKKVKDIAAGVVLTISIFAVIVGILIYIPEIFKIIS